MKKVTLLLALIATSSVYCWPRYKKSRDKIRKGYGFVVQKESTINKKVYVDCFGPGGDKCRGQQPETPPDIKSSWKAFDVAMNLADQYVEQKFIEGVIAGDQTKVYHVKVEDSYERVILRINWWLDENSTLKYNSLYEKL
jgi:hypothetical protein